MKNAIIIILLFICICSGVSNYFFYRNMGIQDSSIKLLIEQSKKDKAKYSKMTIKKNDYGFVNLRLRQVVSENPSLEKKLLKDTAYVNRAAKHN